MEWIFAVMGAACLVYCAAILLLCGFVSFLWFWPVLALLHFLLFGLLRYLRRKRRKKEKVAVRPFVYLLTSYGAGMLVLFALIAVIFRAAHTEDRANLDYVIVLGSDLRQNRISPTLERRLDAAVQYAKENKHTVFVLSGGKGRFDKTTQATAMYYYMIQRGVPAANLLIEFYSKSTLEKVGFSIQTILEDREERGAEEKRLRPQARMQLPAGDVILAEEKPLSVGIIASEVDLFRACGMARRFGLKDICPMATPSDELLRVHLFVREAVALFKDRLVGNI